ncbi:hypothetical protein SERLA73DRAFT_75186 [Serpula lacrymans var. lacrymans S7.3]|uniref:Uncharacterized protein n=1 Tax=Serpula lacrymans var. lacrymans (strain S7.3) TaxID=936435 RepID=F8Q2U8_SERL3|nr:hypothetical protein SERLA73DRAFT_75186 [Serpula lacrymans var. lacrymans S7.3]
MHFNEVVWPPLHSKKGKKTYHTELSEFEPESEPELNTVEVQENDKPGTDSNEEIEPRATTARGRTKAKSKRTLKKAQTTEKNTFFIGFEKYIQRKWRKYIGNPAGYKEYIRLLKDRDNRLFDPSFKITSRNTSLSNNASTSLTINSLDALANYLDGLN